MVIARVCALHLWHRFPHQFEWIKHAGHIYLCHAAKLQMLLFPNALCCSLYERDCVCAVTNIFTKFLPANNFCQLLRVTRKRSCTSASNAQAQLHLWDDQQRAFGISNISNCTFANQSPCAHSFNQSLAWQYIFVNYFCVIFWCRYLPCQVDHGWVIGINQDSIWHLCHMKHWSMHQALHQNSVLRVS